MVMKWARVMVIVIIVRHICSKESSTINMNRTANDCTKHLDVVQASHVENWLRQLTVRRDVHRTSAEAPDLSSPVKLTEFCDTYDLFIARYVALKEADTSEESKKNVRTIVMWLNRLTGTEPLVNTAGDNSVLYQFYFEPDHFITDDKAAQDVYLKLVATNVNYLILAELGQLRRAKGGHQQQAAEPTQRPEAPSPLTHNMFQPPKSAFTQGYLEKAIRFPCTLAELFSDVKSYGKQYSQAIQACCTRKDTTICMD